MTAVGTGPVAGHLPVRGAAPPVRLVVGVGASRGVRADEVLGLIADALRDAGLSPAAVAELTTVDARADEPGLVAAAARLGVPLRGYSPGALARVDVPHPSDAPRAAVGTPSVAEASALACGGELVVPKRKSAPRGRPAMATCAVVRRGPCGCRASVTGSSGAPGGPATGGCRVPSGAGPAHRIAPPGGAAGPGLPQQPHVRLDDEAHHHHHHGSHAHTH